MGKIMDAGHNPDIKAANKIFDNAAKLKYLGMALTIRNCVHE